MKKILFLVSCLFLMISQASAWTHFTTRSGKMCFPETGEVLFEKDSTMLPVRIDPSVSGQLCYLTETDDYYGLYSESYDEWDKIEKSTLERRAYEPDVVMYDLHICDASGEDKHVVPIEQRYGTYYNYAVFYGETAVGLQKVSRQEGKIYELIVNFKTGRKFGFNRGGLCDGTAAENGEHVLYKIENRIYMDGRMILPRYMENPPQVGVHPKEYRAREEAMNAELAKSKIEMLPCDRLSYGAWSPDGRYFAFLDQSRIHPPYQETDRPRVLILDTEAVGPKKTFADYTRQIAIPDPASINMTLQLKWDKSTDSIVLHAYNSSEPLRSIRTSEMKSWTVKDASTE